MNPYELYTFFGKLAQQRADIYARAAAAKYDSMYEVSIMCIVHKEVCELESREFFAMAQRFNDSMKGGDTSCQPLSQETHPVGSDAEPQPHPAVSATNGVIEKWRKRNQAYQIERAGYLAANDSSSRKDISVLVVETEEFLKDLLSILNASES